MYSCSIQLFKVDGNGLLFYLFHNSSFSAGVDAIHGGQYLHFSYIIHKFVKQFEHNNVRLLVVFDGMSEEIKEEESKQRAKQVKKVTEALTRGESVQDYGAIVSILAKVKLLFLLV